VNEPEWISYEVLLAIHAEQLAEHGGTEGIRDQGLLEPALARPKHLYRYSPDASLPQVAAAYALAVAKNHPFVDGNKRTAWILVQSSSN
jgi:death on curing protein